MAGEAGDRKDLAKGPRREAPSQAMNGKSLCLMGQMFPSIAFSETRVKQTAWRTYPSAAS